MTPLRQRMIDDMQARNLSPATPKNYIHYVYELAKFFMRSPDDLEPGDIKSSRCTYCTNGNSQRKVSIKAFRR